MIVYSATKKEFSEDVFNNVIVDKLLRSIKDKKVIGGSGDSHVRSYENSLRFMDKVLQDPEIPDDSGIAVEYVIPSSNMRVDFIITGADSARGTFVVLVELKQWSSSELTGKDAIVRTVAYKGVMSEQEHPSYQAWTYAQMLSDYNEAVYDNQMSLKPCAYLHNYEPDGIINNPFYSEHINKAPVFLKHDADKLRIFIKSFIKYGDSGDVLYQIENGRIRPSKSLADAMSSMMEGNREFIMIGDQKLVYEGALDMVNKKPKQVMIVEGGPGTGKSVVAVNLLASAVKNRLNAQYVTKNAAPRDVYESKLTGQMTKTRFSNLFCSSGKYTQCSKDTFDMLIVDEAHRLNEKSGMMSNKGENQIKEIIHSSKTSVFFLDEDQKVTFQDIGEREEIEKWAKKEKATLQVMSLSSQFRCNGSNGYPAWLDNTLQKRETANPILYDNEYDFKVIDDPNELRDIIYEKNRGNNKARLVAGYCWDWIGKKDPKKFDITFREQKFAMKWNLFSDGPGWMIKPESVSEIGCIHTCQGLELEYVGVIVGPDMICREGKIITDATKRSGMDKSIKGFKKLFKTNPEEALQKADDIIKNTYKTLMTRGMKGCYVYFTDKETAAYFKSRLKAAEATSKKPTISVAAIVDKFKEMIVQEESLSPALQYKGYLPVYSLKAACGYFGEGTATDKEGWLKVPTTRVLDRNMFITKVYGKSMEPMIKDGDYCIFRANVVGSRQGKIVLAQHRDIKDPENGGKYTVKKYTSEKAYDKDGEFRHERIVLKALNKDYTSITIPNEEDGEFMVVAELVEVI